MDQQPPSSEQGREGAPSAWLAFLEQPRGWSAAGNTQICRCGRPGCRGRELEPYPGGKLDSWLP